MRKYEVTFIIEADQTPQQISQAVECAIRRMFYDDDSVRFIGDVEAKEIRA